MSNKLLLLLISGLFHVAGTLIIFGLFSLFFLSSSTAQTVSTLLSDPQLSTEIYSSLAYLLIASALGWTMGYLLFKELGEAQTKTLKRSTGAIATETLIVIPIFFLLTSGLAQLAINQMAGLLTTVSAYEAARVVALWGPEIGNKRFEKVTLEDVQERARVAAAAIVTPVARAHLRNPNANEAVCTPSKTFDNFAAGMEAAGIASQDAALAGVVSIGTYANAFGGSGSFFTRAPAKLRAAYCSISISEDFKDIPTTGPVGKDFSITITYNHSPVFPLVENIFGVSAIKRTYKLRSHIPPNTKVPKD